MLYLLDRHIKFWHVCLANGAALAWFAGMSLSIQAVLPGARLFRCPIGLCLGYYAPIELQATLTAIGRDGRQFLADTLLPLDMVLPALLALALILTCVWFSRPDQTQVKVRASANSAGRTMSRGSRVSARNCRPSLPIAVRVACSSIGA